MKLSRRSFVGSVSAIGAGVATIGTLGASHEADGQIVYMPGDWHGAEFDKLCKSKARVKQVFDATSLAEGGPLSPIKNSFNGLQFGYSVPPDQIKIVAALRGQANLLNFDDSMWEKYKLGEYTKTDDPKTKAPAVRNVFYAKDAALTSTNVNDKTSVYQDYSIEALCGRGMTMLSCHNATMHQAAGIVRRFSLSVMPDEVTKDLQAHMLPGCISVPAMVAAVAMLQCDGKYAYTMG